MSYHEMLDLFLSFTFQKDVPLPQYLKVMYNNDYYNEDMDMFLKENDAIKLSPAEYNKTFNKIVSKLPKNASNDYNGNS